MKGANLGDVCGMRFTQIALQLFTTAVLFGTPLQPAAASLSRITLVSSNSSIKLCGSKLPNLSVSHGYNPFRVMIDWEGNSDTSTADLIPWFEPGLLQSIEVEQRQIEFTSATRVKLLWGDVASYQAKMDKNCLLLRFRIPKNKQAWRTELARFQSEENRSELRLPPEPNIGSKIDRVRSTYERTADVPKNLPSIRGFPALAAVDNKAPQDLQRQRPVESVSKGRLSKAEAKAAGIVAQPPTLPLPLTPTELGVRIEPLVRSKHQNGDTRALLRNRNHNVYEKAASVPRLPKAFQLPIDTSPARIEYKSAILSHPNDAVPKRTPPVMPLLSNKNRSEQLASKKKAADARRATRERNEQVIELSSRSDSPRSPESSSKKVVSSNFGGEKETRLIESPKNPSLSQAAHSPRTLSDIGFVQLDKTSRVFVRLSRIGPFRQRPSPAADTFLLEIPNTEVSRETHLLPMDTSFFPGPVAFFQAKRIGSSVFIEVRLRSGAEWKMKAMGSTIVVDFESL